MDGTVGTDVLERAVGALEPGSRLVGRRELTGGVSATVVALDIATADGRRRRVVFRQHRAEFKQHDHTVTAKEYHVLAALHAAGLAVPEPYAYDDRTPGAAPYLLLQWIDGTTQLAADDVPAGLDQMARFLAALHGVDAGALGVPGLGPVEDPRAAVGGYLPPTALGRRAAAALQRSAVGTDGARPSLLHGDYWPGNVMWQGGRLAAVIDWEDASLGDPLADLATARVELLCSYGADAMDRFTAGYLAARDRGAGPVELDALPLWELYVSAAALATMRAWGLAPADEARRRRRTEAFFEDAVDRLA